MPLPNSFLQQGFIVPEQVHQKIKLKSGQFLKGLLIGQDGPSDSGKTEFALSAPGNIQMVAIDRNFQGMLDNPKPPPTRSKTYGIKTIEVPLQGTAKITDYQAYHASVRTAFYGALDCPDSQVVIMDGDSDWWELHVLAHFGKTTQIFPQTKYAAPYAEKRAINCRAFDSGKIVFMTNKVKDEYETVYKEDGLPEKDPVTKDDVRRKTGRTEPQGFKDRDYLYQIWLHHMFKPAHVREIRGKSVEVPPSWGVMITKCKHNAAMVGTELWGADCNFKTLVETLWPDLPLSRWGF